MSRTLVTCASSDIGKAIIKKLEGDTIVATSRTKKKIRELEAEQNNVFGLELDFSESKSIDIALENEKLNSLDKIVIILPRILPSRNIFPDNDVWMDSFRCIFVNPICFIKGLVEKGKIKNGASIVIISGLSSKHALENYATNNVIRSAWVGQAKSMAIELGERGISVNTLSLGGVMTETYRSKLEEKAKLKKMRYHDLMEEETNNIPLRKYASVENVSEAIAAILGPLSDHMTGQNILLDGGFFRGY
ncbi:SDR family oxidoreductase [Vibrio mediterranei]|uniref:SDR family oxidoreductase n=1 Tax=Vibrio mediterranei TaxID=689 RepID=UPI00148E5F53|nr:SDR family oxidoreductase [Vibrio mediterranei]NOI26374.1 SDR family oxidoreductase [Vibrio mediterranei]